MASQELETAKDLYFLQGMWVLHFSLVKALGPGKLPSQGEWPLSVKMGLMAFMIDQYFISPSKVE